MIVTLDAFRSFVSGLKGAPLRTIGDGKSFTVFPSNDCARFVLENKVEKPLSPLIFQKCADIFNATGSFITSDYHAVTGLSSYVLGVFRVMETSTSIASVTPVIGKIYSWREVEKNWFGEVTYLAKRDGRIVCATLDRSKNPDAPEVMVVGHKPKNVARGEQFCREGGPVPLFIKEASNQWRYKGRYAVAGFTDNLAEVRRYQNDASGPLSRVIFLRPADNQDDLQLLPDVDDREISAPEGKRRWVRHLRRERNRGLVLAKKREALADHGKIVCEACGFNFTGLYRPHAEDFCEVHHLRPLADVDEGSSTRLEDLAILCSNCHRVVHLIDPMPSIVDFAAMIRRNRA